MREDSVATTFRQKRLERFTRLLKPSGITKIIDLGGTVSYWKSLGCLYNDPRVHITILNMFADREYDDGNLTMRRGDACDVAFPDHHFDVVHSNSVIEHVGSTASMARMAQEVVRLAPSYFVQTPNYWFPIEPHFKSPFVHWLPEDVRIRVLRILRKVPSDRERQLKAVRGTCSSQSTPDAGLVSASRDLGGKVLRFDQVTRGDRRTRRFPRLNGATSP
jgi:hypothetical protein